MEAKGQNRRWNVALTAFYILLIIAGFLPFGTAIDPDGTSYLALAHRWASGDFARALNGYWSPWSVWLTAVGLRLGLSETVAAVGQFAIGGGLFLALSIRLIRRQNIPAATLKIIEVCLLLFTFYAVYIQWFNDLWAAAFALWGIQILMRVSRQGLKWASAFLYGVAFALAYYAKAYYLPFFALLTAVWVWKTPHFSFPKKALFAGGAAMVLLLCCLPWWAALQGKYGFFTTGTAGALNISWGLLGHPVFPQGVLLLPPTYPDSPSSWEDPARYNAALVHFWDSPKMAMQQFLRCAYFSIRLLLNAALLSLPAIAILVINGFQFGKKCLRKVADIDPFLVAAVLALFPLGLLFVYSEARYLWPLIPFLFVWIAQQEKGLFLHSRKPLLLLAALGLLAHPLYRLPKIWNAGKTEKAFAEALQEKGVAGGFTTAGPNSPGYTECLRIAHFFKQPYWPAAGLLPTLKEAVIAAEKSGVTYLFLTVNAPLPAGATVVCKNQKWIFIRLPGAGKAAP